MWQFARRGSSFLASDAWGFPGIKPPKYVSLFPTYILASRATWDFLVKPTQIWNISGNYGMDLEKRLEEAASAPRLLARRLREVGRGEMVGSRFRVKWTPKFQYPLILPNMNMGPVLVFGYNLGILKLVSSITPMGPL